MNFESALSEMKAGKCVYLSFPYFHTCIEFFYIQFPDEHSKNTEPYFCVCNPVYGFIHPDKKDKRVPYAFTNSELLSELWEIETGQPRNKNSKPAFDRVNI